MNLDDDKCSTLKKYVGQLLDKKQEPTSQKSEKKKRKLSKYQKFISRCMKSKKIKKFGEASEAMKQCAIEWNQKKSGEDEASR